MDYLLKSLTGSLRPRSKQKPRAYPLPSRAHHLGQQFLPIQQPHPDQPLTDPSNLLHLLLEGAEERIMVEKAEGTLTVEESGITLVEDTDDGNIA